MVARVYEQIQELVAELGLKPGDRLTTETELAEIYDVSRSTVREALRLLEQEGAVHAVQGQGRFISASGSLRLERPMTKYESITEVLTARGYRVSSAVLDVSLSTADAKESEALGIDAGTEVIRLLRIRYGDDEPLVISANTLPRTTMPGPIEHRDWSGSLTAALAGHGHQVNASIATISAVELPEEWQQRYNLADLGPWLRVTEVGMSRQGERVLYAVDYHRGSEMSFSVLRHR
ncbi:MAG TPA: GntR family transcriptional regulator [Candidatus Agrococcus pullicola]|uniref:GntR family transcriptional regulator n=1 Tax=Candidatus Agrococcus pullicola TaxID=2838429 RepID=A0A9D1YWX8_9MICO|nr:GntR family transcriptional regulator [Candidatus Agrococcus pullicola]